VPPPPDGASLRLAHATALVATGDRGGALAECRRAQALLARWPGWRRDRVEGMLARLEGSGTRHPAGELTAREREVAALIAEGLTNGQLAERLFISPKTAAVHVSNILAKLGLASRAEVAAWAVRRELLIPG
jgi:DNA-binding NarL/FixJ family response regulator